MEEIAQALDLRENERNLLRQAHINSLEAKYQQGENTDDENGAADVVGYFGSKEPQLVPSLPPGSGYTEIGKALRGRQAVIAAAINLLRNLQPPDSHKKDSEILLSLQGSDALALQQPLSAGLFDALRAGWSVSHYLRLEKDNRQSVQLIKAISNLLGTGRYQVWYFKRSGKLFPQDALVVPTRGALIFFAANNADTIDSAILIDDPKQVEILQDHFHQLTGKKEPLIQAYLPDQEQRRRYWEALEQGELQAGGRYTVRSGLTGLTRPIDWFTEGSAWLKKHSTASSVDTAWLAAHYQRRIQTFMDNLRAGYVYRDIYRRQGIIDFVKTRNYSQHLPGGSVRVSPEEVQQHLQNVISLLAYRNYEIALVNEDKTRDIVPIPFWEVTGRLRVLIATICTNEKGTPIKVDLEIREPTVVEIFTKHFETLWQELDDASKDKERVIAFLREQIAHVGRS
jgi:hypothetical protein